jgi:ankyrin repeat protein
MAAVARNVPAEVKVLLDAGANVNHRDHRGSSALIVAALECNVEVLRMLLDAGAEVDAADSDGTTALMLAAARHDNAPMVELLLARGASPLLQDHRGHSALVFAASEDNAESATMILSALPKDYVKDPDAIARALKRACYVGRHKVLGVLLEAGADPTRHPPIRNPYEDSSLLMIADHPAAIRMLLAAGMDVDARDEQGQTALMAHSYDGDAEAVATLLELGADTTLIDAGGSSALHHATDGEEPEVVRLLAAAGPKEMLDLVSKADGVAPLALAMDNDDIDTFRALLDAGADPAAVDKNNTPLLCSVQDPEFAAVLLERDPAAVHRRGARGHTPLMAHCCMGSEDDDVVEVVRMLLEHGREGGGTPVDVNERGDAGETALALAARWRMRTVLEMLLDRGADVLAEDDEGLTVVAYAVSGYLRGDDDDDSDDSDDDSDDYSDDSDDSQSSDDRRTVTLLSMLLDRVVVALAQRGP